MRCGLVLILQSLINNNSNTFKNELTEEYNI